MDIIQTLTSKLTEGEAILRIPQPGPRQIKWKRWSEKMTDIVQDDPEFKSHHLSLTYRSLKSDLEKLRAILNHYKQKEIETLINDEPMAKHQEQNKDAQIYRKNGHINVFISYKNEDTALAKVVKEQLTTLNFDRVKVFLITPKPQLL